MHPRLLNRGRGPVPEAMLLLAATASLMLPVEWAPLLFGALIGGWWWLRRQTGRSAGTLIAAALVLAAFAADAWSGSRTSSPERVRLQAARGYEALWQQLEQAADRVVLRLAAEPADRSDLERWFQPLALALAEGGPSELTVYLVNPLGVPVAWAGKGLLHDPQFERLPARGGSHLASFSAVSVLLVRPLSGTLDRWRLVVGQSLAVDRFPFAGGSRELETSATGGPRWTLVGEDAEAAEGLLAIRLADRPTLLVENLAAGGDRRGAAEPARLTRIVGLAWGLWLLTLAGRRIIGAVDEGSARLSGPNALAASLLPGASAIAISWAAATSLPSSMLLAFAATFALWCTLARPVLRSPAGGAIWGATVLLVLLASAWWLQQARGPIDLGSAIFAQPDALAGRLTLFLLVLGLFALTPTRRGDSQHRGGTFAYLAMALLLLAAVSVDHPAIAGSLLLLAGALGGSWRGWLAEAHWRSGTLAVLAMLAALSAAVGWEIAHRMALRDEVSDRLLAGLAPPTPEELEALAAELEVFFAGVDVGDFAVAGAGDLDLRDLAFEIWHHSPLARSGGTSAVVVEAPGERLSTFSFGLPVDKEGQVDWSLPRWRLASIPVWGEAVLTHEADLTLEGLPWARARFWLALRPGFRLPVERRGDLTAGLLRAEPGGRGPLAGEMDPIDYALYDPRGRVLVGPWRETPSLAAALLNGGTGVVEVPTGKAEVFTARGLDGIRAVFLSRLSPVSALERVGTHALTGLIVLGAAALTALALRLRSAGWRVSWLRVWRSYSQRLVLVYSTLLLVPLVLMNLVVVRALEERLRLEQLAGGQAALESAQRMLGEYVLALEPGFGIDAALSDDLLVWLAGVVHHDINLYWRSSVYASSKADLFTAGLLPRRIPGEIYADLTLERRQLASRVNRAGGAQYLELYAPLTVPGVSLEEARLFLSLPLLAQQEETATQIASLWRRAILGTAVLIFLVVALGDRLARRFTAPLTDIVDGTQRIAAGEASLRLRPTATELATLVEAIDRMAASIDEGRRRLMAEKQVVERMVENITAGVISLDSERRVLMVNRVAVELVGAAIGESLEAALGRRSAFAPLREFIAGVSDTGPAQTSMRLPSRQGGDRDWSLVWVPLPGSGEPSALLVIEDVTDVVRSQRLEAWAEMARMIAHEIKNPLTPIRLSTEHLREVYARDPQHIAEVLEACTDNILRQVGELQEIATEFSTYSRIPKIEPKRGDLAAVVEKMLAAYRTAPPRSIRIEFRSDPTPLMASFDAKLITRAVRNLLENALRVTPDGGLIEVTLHETDGLATIAVADNGPGVRPAELQRIFDPYFSTHDAGTGLGLPIARRIAEEHGGEISARNREQGGLEVVISLRTA